MLVVPQTAPHSQHFVDAVAQIRTPEFYDWNGDPCQVIDMASLAALGDTENHSPPFIISPEKLAWANGSRQSSGSVTTGPEGPLVSTSKTSRNHPNGHLGIPVARALSFNLYHKSARVCRNTSPVLLHENPISSRPPIFEFSQKSKASLTHVCDNSGHHIKSQILLTYHEKWPTDGREAKRHLATFLKALRRWSPDVKYLWVLEFQFRGAPHFHLWMDQPALKSLRHYLACAWVRITNGTDAQMRFHDHPNNFFDWEMNDPMYPVKYAEKNEQKQVPEEFHNCGRFWGCSYNMIPKPDVCTVEAIANITSHLQVPWEVESISKFFHKVLRRHHEKLLNHKKTHKKVQTIKGDTLTFTSIERRKNHKGQIFPRKKSPLTRFSGGELVNGNYRIPHGTKIFYQLLNYIVEHCPDRWSLQAAIKARIPF